MKIWTSKSNQQEASEYHLILMTLDFGLSSSFSAAIYLISNYNREEQIGAIL